MFPHYTKLKLYEILEERFGRIGHKTIEESMIGFINKKLIPVVFYEAGFDLSLIHI